MGFSLLPIKCLAVPPNLWLLYYCVSGNQIVEQSSDKKTVCSHNRKLGEVAKHLIDSSKNDFVSWALNFKVYMLLKFAENLFVYRSVYLQKNLFWRIRCLSQDFWFQYGKTVQQE